MMKKKICVMGVGNVLLRDEGAGVRVVEQLLADYRFDDQVALLDGGTLGMELLVPIEAADLLIIADVVKNGGEPGAIHRLNFDDLRAKITTKNSLHEVNLTETLSLAEMMGILPETIVVGIEPQEISAWSTDLTPPVKAGMNAFARALLSEIEAAGATFEREVKGAEQPDADWIPGGGDDKPRCMSCL